MTVTIQDLPLSARGWLHPLAVANVQELAPDLPAPGPDHYDHYWSDSRRTPLALWHQGQKIGFAMIRETTAGPWELAEFYILPQFRRRGLGTAAAHAVMGSKPGAWVLGVARLGNAGAFWHATLTSADWVHDLTQVAAFYPAQSHGYRCIKKDPHQKALS